MAQLATPPAKWTQRYPDLGTGLVSYEDSISPEFYELEREAIFRRAWLNVGRVEQLPRKGSYFTKELAVAKTSLLVTRDLAGEIHAFHNVCRHRGNKLVWDHTPRTESSGVCRQFMCKYHGWRYGVDGALKFVLQEEEFFDFDKADFPLVPVHCEVWEGFVFVNLADEPSQSLRDFLGPMVLGLEGYPFHLCGERYAFRSEISSNWKIFLDAFQEYYHASVLHSQQQVPSLRSFESGYKIPHFQIDGPHRLVSTGGWKGVPRHLTPPDQMYPIEHATRSGLMGPWERPDIPELDPANLPPGLNPGNLQPWSISNFQIFPNFVILVYERGWYLTYQYWPTSVGTHDWEMSYYFPPARTASERIRHEVTAVVSKEAALQDAATLDGTQMGLESRAIDKFPLSDQELTVRHHHKVVGDWVEAYLRDGKDARA
ncbi:aromatic ring-hydroxylating dioxygenase subunit alpha [Frankia sp. AgB1.9]|uniref:aromatic ring-hydroxylating oxygenase subunit alpha n=1 Tax=unclassified Frankia TaxID=2632575 RepID=UPI00193450A7|nr:MULTISPECIES: aromatic ring-hydroxylating dioxygenase subunit alpha [unclassified Frankia]MBL7488358.1 aromatic ring-hydroxylating dioxygenase subunit alpha [Frankia sp. AgW1.1]MBL7547694.1 aromatic ring-hydroxylating dioxygenase subunit alpha [Frankia sp. AgB1.9]MBL7624061.1 aromatic ring-hydroxylating dioxygenase subunit alpha [Frankia sp. AgB1.8]